MKRKIIIALVAALLVVGGAVACTKQPEPETKPTMSEVETPVEAPVEQPMETPTETPVEGDTAVEGQPAADETSATGNLGGSVGENNFGMTNLMDSIKDNNQTDVEHSLDLEEQKQEQSQSSSGNEGTVGSVEGSDGNGAGTQTGVPSGNEGSGSGSSVGGNSGTDTQPQAPSNPQPQTPSEGRFNSKEDVESLGSVDKVTGYNDELGGWEVITDTGRHEIQLPDGTAIDKELLDILKQYSK